MLKYVIGAALVTVIAMATREMFILDGVFRSVGRASPEASNSSSNIEHPILLQAVGRVGGAQGSRNGRVEYSDKVGRVFRTEDGTLAEMFEFRLDASDRPEKHGVCTYWGRDGCLVACTAYEHGVSHGRSTHYGADGRPLIEESYERGQLHGVWTRFHMGGCVAEQGLFLFGRREGAWVTRHEGGSIAEYCVYAGGKANGPYRKLSVSGVVEVEGVSVDGLCDGSWKYRRPTGQVECEQSWRSGRLEGFVYYDESQQYVRRATKQEDGKYRIEHYQDGRVVKTEVVDALVEGPSGPQPERDSE